MSIYLKIVQLSFSKIINLKNKKKAKAEHKVLTTKCKENVQKNKTRPKREIKKQR